MDELGGLLDGPRAKGAFLLRSIMTPPWSIRVQDEAPLTVVAIVEGEATIIFDNDEPKRMCAGDVAVIRGPDPYVVADCPTTAPQVVIHPGQECKTLNGESLALSMELGVRTWGNNAEGTTVMLTGTYQYAGEISRRLLEALPKLIILKADAWNCAVVPLLADEIVKDESGQEAVLDRLLDLLVIAVLRAWFSGPDSEVPAWYSARADPIIGKALRMMHGDPSRPWTVANLASTVGVSRAALARRFNELVGEPPMTFLTAWRLALAADLLTEPDASVGSVGRRVGYSSPFTFSAAFKRSYGVSPLAHRSKHIDKGESLVSV